ncbi:(deoxy)nucleoside triphosphate pyrophosphohydrolase [Lutibacter sp. B2]|nr:(deoxy)nucleoside triphosphate pyrophosphohydrolase [Lutibacter sp. B2]
MIDVVAAILQNHKGEILIARRKKGKVLEGYWEFPGGKIEKGESSEQSLVRELKEEMNIEIEVSEYVGENIHRYENQTIRLLAFKGEIVSGEIELVDHDKYVWVDLYELRKFELAPADIPIVALLANI